MIPTEAGQRIAAVDLARGAALLGMIAYHLVWDLHAFGLSTTDPGVSLPWHILGQTVASAFLFLSGLSLVLARRRGGSFGQALWRIATIAIAGEAVTVVTALIAPDETVLFGILQCIALSNLLALPLLDAPVSASLVLGAVLFAVPAVVPANAAPSLWWLGLSDHGPDTLDVRPLMPWAGMVLLGVAFGQACWRLRPVWKRTPLAPGLSRSGRLTPGRRLDRGWCPRGVVAAWRGGNALLAAAGRHSLTIYLAHQPALFGGFLILAAMSIGSRPIFNGTGASFVSSCTDRCIAQDTDPERCMALCRCVQGRLNEDPAAARQPESLTLYATACVNQPSAPMSRR